MYPRYILALLFALTFAVANSLDSYPNSQTHHITHKRHHPPLEEEENTQLQENTEVNGYHGKPKGKHPPNEEEKHDEVDGYHHKPPHGPPNNNPSTDAYHPPKPPRKGHPPRQGDNSQEDNYVNKKPPHGGHGDHHPDEPPYTPNHIN